MVKKVVFLMGGSIIIHLLQHGNVGSLGPLSWYSFIAVDIIFCQTLCLCNETH